MHCCHRTIKEVFIVWCYGSRKVLIGFSNFGLHFDWFLLPHYADIGDLIFAGFGYFRSSVFGTEVFTLCICQKRPKPQVSTICKSLCFFLDHQLWWTFFFSPWFKVTFDFAIHNLFEQDVIGYFSSWWGVKVHVLHFLGWDRLQSFYKLYSVLVVIVTELLKLRYGNIQSSLLEQERYTFNC